MNKFPYLLFVFSILFSCGEEPSQSTKNYIESRPSFFELKHGDLLQNNWIRNPENLKVIHESFKTFGYSKLNLDRFPNDDLFLIHGVYIKKNFKNLLDSLIISYKKPVDDKYYDKFWMRRKKENNDSILFQIIKEIQAELFQNKAYPIRKNYVNDTLVKLLEIEYDTIPKSKTISLKDFQTLINFGMHQSAYNLLYERPEYSKIDLDRKKLQKELIEHQNFIYPWLIDTEK